MTLTNSTVSGNSATSEGAGIYNLVSGTVTLTNSTVSGNSAGFGDGGGIYNFGMLTLTNSTVSGNSAFSGGGIYNFGVVMLTNSTVSGNSASFDSGGGIYNRATLTLANSRVRGNSADLNGGGIYNFGSATLTLTNSTVSGNSADQGGGLANYSTMTLTNSIIAKNNDDGWGSDIYNNAFANLNDMGHNLIGDGNGHDITNATNNNIVGLDPLFITDVDTMSLPNNTGDLRLRICSPAVDAGLNSALPKDTFDIDMDLDSMEMLPLDLAGELRVFGSAVDIGAYETQQLTTDPLVVMNTNDDGPQSLRYLVDVACEGDTITFATAIDMDTIKLTSGEITLNKNLVIIGNNPSAGSGQASNTIIDGMNTSRIFHIPSGDTVCISGIKMQGGNGAGAALSGFGGAILNEGVATLKHSAVSGNTITTLGRNGGGIVNLGTLMLLNTAVNDNSATSSGGGISSSGMVTLTNSTVSGNSASLDGGGIFNVGTGTVTLTNSTVSGNSAIRNGGGIYNVGTGTVTLTNSTVSGNSAGLNGGGIYNFSSATLTLTNCTLSGNSADQGGGLANYSTMTLTNSIIAKNNDDGWGSDIYNNAFANLNNMGHNLIGDGNGHDITNATNNNIVGVDPLFITDVDTMSLPNNTGDLRLRICSPAVDAGKDTIGLNLGLIDLAGEDRVFGTAVDIGAYETQQLTTDPLVVMNTNDDGSGSLRYLADVACEGDTITFATAIDMDTIKLTSGEITLDKNLVIIGNDTTNTIIDGMNSSRIFHIPAGDTVIIDGVKLQHGNGGGTIFSNNGGAILNQGHLTLNDAFIIDNLVTVSGASEASRGGGVFNGGILNVSNSNISGNTATAAGSAFGSIGGGIYNDSTLTLTNSVIAGNSATISGNAFLSFGGGVMNNDVATADFINSTISGNIAVVGGGVGNDVNCTVTMTNTTMAGNSATISGGGFINSGSLMLLNSIVAQNVAPVAPDINNDSNSSTTIIDGGHNLIGDTTSVGSDFVTSTLLGNSAMPLDPFFIMDVDTMNLPNMGGDLRLQCGSPAIDAGKQDTMGLNIGAVDLDSLNRVVDTIDIGAYEFQFDNMPTSTQDSTICENDLPLTWGGVTFTMAGTLMETIANSNGCDSVITYNLSVNENTSSTQDSTICENDLPLTWGNVTFMMAGTLMDTIANANGCDSLITYNLTVNENTSSTQDSTICENDLPLTWGNVTFMMAGTLMDTIANANGCDSLITYNLTVNENTSSTQDSTICENDLPLAWGNVTFTMGGTLMDTIPNANGCDSLITYNLTVNENTSSTQDSTICENDLPLTWGNVTFMMAGTIMDTIANANGCDSLITYNLSVNENTSSTQDSTICENDLPLTWGNVTFMMAGTLMDTIPNANGCDSLTTYNLTVNENTSSTQDSTICENDLPLTWGNVTFMMAGTLMDTIANANGCDSLITYILMVNENTSSTQDSTICENDLPLTWGNVTFMMAGTLMDTIANANTCDSVITYNLTVNELSPAPSIIGPAVVCQNLSDITYEIVSPDPAVTYTWEIVSGSDVTIVGSGSLISLDFGPAATDIVLQVSAEGICDSPTATMSITIGSPEFCELASCLRENIYVDDELLSLTTAIQVYKANNEITSDAIVEQPLIFKAGQSIEFYPRFEVILGTVFVAQIEACQN